MYLWLCSGGGSAGGARVHVVVLLGTRPRRVSGHGRRALGQLTSNTADTRAVLAWATWLGGGSQQ